jgi:hypothetical protein
MKIKIETKFNKVFREKDYDAQTNLTEREFWTKYCELFSVANVELNNLEKKVLTEVLTYKHNVALFTDMTNAELAKVLNTSKSPLHYAKTSLVEKGILIRDESSRELLLSKQFSTFQLKVKELIETKNLKNIQIQFNFSIE